MIIQLPDGAMDLENIALLNANDPARIRIQRDREYQMIDILNEDYTHI